MTKNQRIPWLRIGAESVAIVASILFAFAIDAWWARLQQAERESQYMEALRGEFQAVLNEVDGDIARREQRVEAYEWILSAISQQREVGHEETSVRLTLLFGFSRFLPPHGVYDDFVGSESLRSLDAGLRRALLEYGEQADRLRWTEDRQDSAYFEGVYPYMLAHTDWLAMPVIGTREYQVTHDSGFEGLMKDRQFQNLLISNLRDLDLSQRVAMALREAVEEVLILLDTELS